MPYKINDIVFLIIGLGIALVLFSLNFNTIRSASWIDIEAKYSILETDTFPINTKYKGTVASVIFKINYSYVINNKTYSANAVINTSNAITKSVLNANDGKIQIKVNPNNPEESVLKSDFGSNFYILGLLSILFLFSPILRKIVAIISDRKLS